MVQEQKAYILTSVLFYTPFWDNIPKTPFELQIKRAILRKLVNSPGTTMLNNCEVLSMVFTRNATTSTSIKALMSL